MREPILPGSVVRRSWRVPIVSSRMRFTVLYELQDGQWWGSGKGSSLPIRKTWKEITTALRTEADLTVELIAAPPAPLLQAVIAKLSAELDDDASGSDFLAAALAVVDQIESESHS